jgi:hypothetical protein
MGDEETDGFDGSSGSFVGGANVKFRMEVKKNLWEYIRDKWGWWRLTEERREGWIPPDWYRMKTDDEFRDRIKRELGEPLAPRY